MSKTTKIIIHILALAIAAALFETFFLLCMKHFQPTWKNAVYLSVIILGSIANGAVFTVDLLSLFLHRETLSRMCITAYLLLDFFAILFFILVRTGFFDVMRDKERFEEFLSRSGNWMAVLFVVLQFLQVVILPIPSTVTVAAGAALFGPLVGSLLSLFGILLGSLVAFFIGRYAGVRVVAWLVGKDTLEKWLKKIEGKDKLLLSAMFVLPVFPDDVLCFVAGISSMSVWLFLGVILVSRVLAIFTTSYSITLIPFNTWWGLMIWAILIALVIVLFVILYKKSDAILNWIAKKFHRETRVKEEVKRDEFSVSIVSPDGNIHEKGVKKEGDGAASDNGRDAPDDDA